MLFLHGKLWGLLCSFLWSNDQGSCALFVFFLLMKLWNIISIVSFFFFLVKFWAGKLCSLSLNVVLFFVRFFVGSCGVCCALFCAQIIREVVHFLCSFCMGSCAFEICYLFQKHDREHKKKHEDNQGFSLSKIISLAKFFSDQNFSLKNFSFSNFFP